MFGLQILVLFHVHRNIAVLLYGLQDRLLEIEVELTRCGIVIHLNFHDAVGLNETYPLWAVIFTMPEQGGGESEPTARNDQETA